MALVTNVTLTEQNDSSALPLSGSGSPLDVLVITGTSYTNLTSDFITWLRSNNDFQVIDEALSAGGQLVNDPSQFDAVWLLLPDSNINNNDKAKFQALIDAGGRIIAVGENPGFAATPNAAISDLSAYLGGNISITSVFDAGDGAADQTANFYPVYDNANGVINLANNQVLDGVSRFDVFTGATLEIDDSLSEVYIVDDVGGILVADQILSNGRMTVLADINGLSNVGVAGLTDSNKIFFSNLIYDAGERVNNLANSNSSPENTIPGAQSTPEDTSLSITGISVTDVDGNLATTQLTVNNGTLSVVVSGGASISSGSNNSADLTLSGTEAQINAALATLSYTPTTNYNGSDTLTVVSTDSDGTPLSDSDTVAITVNAVDDSAVVSGDITGSGDEDTTTAITGTLAASDVEGLTDGTVFSIAIADQPTNGTATIAPASGAWSYVPNANFNGTDSFSVTITDDLGGTTAQTVTITVNAVDDSAVVSSGTTGSGAEDTSAITGTLVASDLEGLTDGTVFSITDGNGPANGSASIDAESGAWSYTPFINFFGTDSFYVTITDDLGGTTLQTISITVKEINDKSSVLTITSNGGTQTPVAQIVTTTEVANGSSLSNLRDLGIALSNKAIDFEVELDDDTATATANIPLAVLEDELALTSDDGKRDFSIAPIYYAINDQGALTPLSYDPLVNAGARFYDTDGDGIADFLSLKLIDGGFGDKDGVKNGVIDDPSALGTVTLDPVLTALDNGFLQVADAANAAPAALALQASLTSRANAVTEIGYVILNAGEEASTVSDITALQERANLLFSALENNDVTLAEAMTFNSQFLLRNGQSIRFFAVTDGTLADLTSLDDSRFSFLDGSVDATTGAVSFSSASGIGFDLTLLNSDQNLGALIAQEQHAAPLLDFTAFTNDETITGTIVQGREAAYDAVTGFYRVLDTSGSVRAADGSLLTPGDAGYAAAAQLEANRISAFGDLSIADGESSSTAFSLQDASYIAPFAQVEGNTFFAFADANTDGLSHFRSLGSNLFGLEDQLGGGDLDYDDHIVGFSIGGLTPATPAVA